MENIKHCYIAIGLHYLSNQAKKKSLRFKFAEVKSHLRLQKCKKLPPICGFAVADHLLLFYGIRGCGIEFKFAVPSTANYIRSLKLCLRQHCGFVLYFYIRPIKTPFLSILSYSSFNLFLIFIFAIHNFFLSNG